MSFKHVEKAVAFVASEVGGEIAAVKLLFEGAVVHFAILGISLAIAAGFPGIIGADASKDDDRPKKKK